MIFPPGPRRPPLLQSLAYMRRPLDLFDECRERFGKIFRLRLVGDRDVIVLADPEDVREVFRGDPDVFHAGNKSFDVFFGKGSILALDGEEHKRHRKVLGPSFRGERMAEYVSLTRDLVGEAMTQWPVGTPFSLLDTMQEITFKTILSAVFGPQTREDVEEFIRRWEGLSGLGITLAGFIPALRVRLGGLSPWARYERNAARVDELIFDAIAKARAGVGERQDILATLVRLGDEGLSDQELRDEMMTVVSAGHETTTAGLSWTFQSVLADSAVVGKIRAEVQDVVGDGPVEGAHLKQLKYLDAVVNESLRLNPPLAICARRLTQDTELAGHQLPAGTYVYPCMHLVHRDPELYSEPLAFRPERFLEKRPTPFEFFPFGGGARTCLGLAMAIFQMKLTLATVLPHAQLTLQGERDLRIRRCGVTLMPASGTPVVLEKAL